ncbi:MAG TPA: tetratricopeptide repeat protein [Vicinamibacterales bacterium]|nr:tetratricopeptide repeat protein [Vicinamibacterales bacterium]
MICLKTFGIGRLRLRPDRVVVAVCMLMLAACSSKTDTPAKTPPTYTLREVVLPDLSHAVPSVQEQLRAGYATFKQTLDVPSTPSDQLGAAYGQMGMLLMAAEYRGEAEAALLDAQTLNPRDPRWPYYLGHLYKLKGDGESSNAAFARALELQPNDVPNLIWCGEGALDQGKFDEAEADFAKALSLQPRSVAAQYGVGRAALAKQEYAKAVEHLDRALSLDPQATIIQYPLAMAYRGLGDQARAQVHLSQRGTLAIKPDDPMMDRLNALLNSALAYEVSGADALDRGDFKAAADSFRKGVEVDPKEPSLHHKLGTALALLGDKDGAVDQFEQAIRLNPNFVKAHYSLAVIQSSTGQPAAAIQHLNAALKTEPGYVEARMLLANVLRRDGKYEASLPEYAQIVKQDARVPEARYGYAAALIRLRRYADARDYLVDAIKLYPNELVFANALARVLAAAPDDKVRDGHRALETIQPVVAQVRASDILETMAMAQAEVGQFTEAVTWQKEAIEAAERNGQHDVAQIITDNLRLYESRRPCRTPWRTDEPIEFQTTGSPQAVQSPHL